MESLGYTNPKRLKAIYSATRETTKRLRLPPSCPAGQCKRFRRRTASKHLDARREANKVGALIIRRGFWGPLYRTYNEEPQNSIGNYLAPYSTLNPKPLISALIFCRPTAETQRCWLQLGVFLLPKSDAGTGERRPSKITAP